MTKIVRKRKCGYCGEVFDAVGKQLYHPECAKKKHAEQQKKWWKTKGKERRKFYRVPAQLFPYTR